MIYIKILILTLMYNTAHAIFYWKKNLFTIILNYYIHIDYNNYIIIYIIRHIPDHLAAILAHFAHPLLRSPDTSAGHLEVATAGFNYNLLKSYLNL